MTVTITTPGGQPLAHIHTNKTMRILHTITCTRFVKAYNANEEFTRHLTRTRRLTYAGVQRMFDKGCEEYEPTSGINVTRIETAIFQR